MREIQAILSAYDALKTQGQPCVLATVVHVEGSSYRQAGARMLIAEDGQLTGAISGGCLEGDALKKALLVLRQGHNKLVTYDTTDEEDAIVGAQLGCNGVIQVLLEPIRSDHPDNPLELLRLLTIQEETLAVVTSFNTDKQQSQPGTQAVFDQTMNLHGHIEGKALLRAIQADVFQAFKTQNSQVYEYHIAGKAQQVFIEICPPPPHLVLVGAGNDALAPAQIAGLLGWKVTVADGRPTHANSRRFAGACQVLVSKPEMLLDKLRIDSRTAFVLMTHNYPYDLAVFRLLLQYPDIPYIGILGPRKKYLRMLDDLSQEGIRLSPEQEARVFAPVGLDLGAENAAEIGLSVLSEIQAVLSHASGEHLRNLPGPIHDTAQQVLQIRRL